MELVVVLELGLYLLAAGAVGVDVQFVGHLEERDDNFNFTLLTSTRSYKQQQSDLQVEPQDGL